MAHGGREWRRGCVGGGLGRTETTARDLRWENRRRGEAASERKRVDSDEFSKASGVRIRRCMNLWSFEICFPENIIGEVTVEEAHMFVLSVLI